MATAQGPELPENAQDLICIALALDPWTLGLAPLHVGPPLYQSGTYTGSEQAPLEQQGQLPITRGSRRASLSCPPPPSPPLQWCLDALPGLPQQAKDSFGVTSDRLWVVLLVDG